MDCPTLDEAARRLGVRAAGGRRAADPGGRKRGRAGDGSSRELPDGVQADFPLARLTTIRTGGAADFYARPESPERLAELLAWADAEGHQVGVIGSGSNLLVADAGFRGLVMKLDGPLAQIEREDARLRCGGGARLPWRPRAPRARG